ncbi:MAG: DUF1353 domain-containing protein [Actinomycetota bacterium]
MSGPWGDQFLIDDEPGNPIRLEQIDAKEFVLRSTIEFHGDMGLSRESYPEITEEMKAEARRLDAGGRSDLASVPQFLRWFANPYGVYTPAALIHDDLIVGGEANAGTLRSDAAADRYFRFLLRAAGVDFFRRWIMWAAVALRTRWAVGGRRRAFLIVWIALSVLGLTAFFSAVGELLFDTGTVLDIDSWPLLIGSAATPFVAGGLWGKQWGASLVAAVAAPWILPPTLLAAVAYVSYRVLELGANVAGRSAAARRPRS